MTDATTDLEPVDVEPVDVEPVQPTHPTVRAPAPKSNRLANAFLTVAGLIAISGIAFAGGRLTAPAATNLPGDGGFAGGPAPGGSFGPGAFPSGGPGGLGARPGAVTIDGEVTAVTDTSITVRLENGSTVEVPVDGGTEYLSATQSTANDVAVGDEVRVQPRQPGFNPGASQVPAASGAPSVGTAQQVIVLSD